MKNILAEPGQGVTLGAYIKYNEHLLSALGVFTTLTVLSGGNPSGFFKYVLSIIFFIGMILVGLEIYFNLPKKQTLRLFLFQYVLHWGGIAIIAYCIYEFRIVSNLFLFFPMTLLIFWFLLGSFLPVLRRFQLTRNIFGIDSQNKTVFQKILRTSSIILLVVFSLFFGIYFSSGINLMFEFLNHAKI